MEAPLTMRLNWAIDSSCYILALQLFHRIDAFVQYKRHLVDLANQLEFCHQTSSGENSITRKVKYFCQHFHGWEHSPLATLIINQAQRQRTDSYIDVIASMKLATYIILREAPCCALAQKVLDNSRLLICFHYLGCNQTCLFLYLFVLSTSAKTA